MKNERRQKKGSGYNNSMAKSNSLESVRFSLAALVESRFYSLLIIFFVTVLAFSNIFANGFAMDDENYILNWPLIRDWHNLPRFFVGYIPPEGQEGVYSPLKTLLHSFQYHLFAAHPLGYHVMSLFIHLAGVTAVYLLAGLLTGQSAIAFWTALLFAVHPVHVESVTYMTASVDTVGTVLLLFSSYFYVRGSGTKGMPAVSECAQSVRDDRRAFWLAVPAVFTNELSLSLPLIILFYEWFFRRGGVQAFIPALRRALPFFVLDAVYVLCKWIVFGAVHRGEYVMNSFGLTMLVTIKAWMQSIAVLFWPATLTHNHEIAPGIFSFDQRDFDPAAVLTQSLLDPQTFIGLILVLGLVLAAVRFYRRAPIVSFCAGFFFLSLIPVSNVIPIGVYFSERFLYAGSFAFCLLVSYGLWSLFCMGRRQGKAGYSLAAGLVMFGLCLFYTTRTYLRNFDWKDQTVLLEKASAAAPASASLHGDLAISYIREGKYERSLAEFDKAIALKPLEAHYYFSREEAYLGLKRYDDAVRTLEKAVELNPQFAEGYYNLSGIHAFLGSEQKALGYLVRAVELYEQQGRVLEAGRSSAAMVNYLKAQKELLKTSFPTEKMD